MRNLTIRPIAWCFTWWVAFTLPASALAQPGNAEQAPAARQQPEAAYRYWTTQWSFQDIEIENLTRRLRRIGIEVPIDADGIVSLDFSVSVPLNALGTGSAYRLSGNISAPRLRLEQLQLSDFSTDVRYESGVMSLERLRTVWATAGEPTDQGRLEGNASLELIPRGELQATLRAERLAIAPLYDLILVAAQPPETAWLRGTVDGDVHFRSPVEALGDVQQWTLDADLRAADLRISDSVPMHLHTGPVALRQNRFSAPALRLISAQDPDIRLNANIDAELAGERRFDVDVVGNDVPLESLSKLVSLGASSLAKGKLDLDATAQGSLGREGIESATWNVIGRLASPGLEIAGAQLGVIEHELKFDNKRFTLTRLPDSTSDQVKIDRVAASYRLDADAYELRELDAELFDGNITGEALVARTPDGTHHVDLQWQDLAPQFDTSSLLPASVSVSFGTSGQVQWKVPAAQVDQLESHDGTASITIDPIRIGAENAGETQLAFSIRESEVTLQGEGSLFGGSFKVDTSTSVAALGAIDWRSLLSFERWSGQVALDRVSLARVHQTLARTGYVSPSPKTRWYGFVSGQSTFGTHESTPTPSGWKPQGTNRLALESSVGTHDGITARITADHLGIGNAVLGKRVDAALRWRDGVLTIDSLGGGYAGGRIDAMGRIRTSDGQGRVEMRVASIDAARGLMPIAGDTGNTENGRLSGHITLESGLSLRGRGALQLQDSELANVPVGNVHASLILNAQRDLSRWTLSLNGIESVLGNGRVQGSATLMSSSIGSGVFDLSSQWEARRVDFGRLMQEVSGGANGYARGSLDGTLTLEGRAVRSVADLNGRFNASLGGTQARAVPGLVSAQSYLGAFSLAGTQFDSGRIRGSIARGTAGIDEFWLLSDQVRVFADGRVGLGSGRMDVAAIISTGNFTAQNAAITTLAQTLAIDAAVPVAALIRANQLLSDRTLYVDVIGDIRDPRLRLKPLGTLQQGVTRIFLRQAASAISPIGIVASESRNNGTQ